MILVAKLSNAATPTAPRLPRQLLLLHQFDYLTFCKCHHYATSILYLVSTPAVQIRMAALLVQFLSVGPLR